MLTYDEALARILAAVPINRSLIALPLMEASGYALAESITAPVDLPPFDNTAVDGFALNLADSTKRPPNVIYPIVRTIAAGDIPGEAIAGDTAVRIFTGAPVPPGCDAIVMVEDTESINDGKSVLIKDAGSAHYIRKAGSDIRAGTLALPAGTRLDAGSIGLLASFGQQIVSTVRRPRVALLSTGDELLPFTTETLPPGKIRDSNGPALATAILEAGGELVFRQHIPDDEAATRAAFTACTNCDVIITSGGVSVGDRDFVRLIAEEVGTLDFWRVAIRPGKPLAFGRIGDALYFGLPGNPVSSLVTFELFVRPVLRQLCGFQDVLRPQIPATLTADLPHESGRREFVRAKIEWRDGTCYATPTGAQGSHRITSLIGANAYIIAHESHEDYPAGDTLPALLLI